MSSSSKSVETSFSRARRAVATAAMTALGVVSISSVSHAQAASTGAGVELRPFVGAFIPTGDLSDQLKAAVLVGGQVGWQFHPNFAVTGSFGWAPSKDKTTASTGSAIYTGAEETIDLFQYDIGIEGRMPMQAGTSWMTSPYVTLGLGGRTYNYRDIDANGAQTNFLGFGGVGVDIAPKASMLGLRLEARDNISAFKGLRGELSDSKARNDVQLTAGLTFNF